MPSSAETLHHKPLPELLENVSETTLKPVTLLVPENAGEQKAAFLAGEIDNPEHHYDRLEKVNFDATRNALQYLRTEIEIHPDISPKFADSYQKYFDRHLTLTAFLETAHQLRHVTDPDERGALQEEYMRHNIELHGEPERPVYEGLVNEQRETLTAKPLTGEAAKIRDELFALLPETSAESQRFIPTDKTVAWMHDVAMSLYGDMLAHVPDRAEKFEPQEIRDVFERIIRGEFGEVAENWETIVTKAKSISVVPELRQIKIPTDRAPISSQKLKGLVCHELGVHFLRSVMGEQTDFSLMRHGLVGYSDAEEGLGKVMEQALNGQYKDSGIPYYLAAGLAYFEGKDFRDVHEVLWRYRLLDGAKSDKDTTEDDIASSKSLAYGQVMRIMRGTDQLPWFKDLSYYNGNNKMWQHLEAIRGDDLRFLFVLLGKADPSNQDHQRLMLETKNSQ